MRVTCASILTISEGGLAKWQRLVKIRTLARARAKLGRAVALDGGAADLVLVDDELRSDGHVG